MNGFKALKLRVDDDEDLAVIAACLHGAICCLGEMAYDREVRRFAAMGTVSLKSRAHHTTNKPLRGVHATGRQFFL